MVGSDVSGTRKAPFPVDFRSLAQSVARVCPCRFGKQFWTATYTQRDDGVVLSVLAFMAAFFGVWAGSKLKLDYSAKLFTMTFLLVTFGAAQDNSALHICTGLPVQVRTPHAYSVRQARASARR